MLVRHVLSQLSYAPELLPKCCTPQRHGTLYMDVRILSSTFLIIFRKNFLGAKQAAFPTKSGYFKDSSGVREYPPV